MKIKGGVFRMFTAINLKKMFSSILIVELIGAVSIIIASTAMSMYRDLILPDFAAPLVFIIVTWGILFAFLGVAFYFVQSSSNESKSRAASRFWLQLFFICVWPILFFNLRAFGVSAIWMLFSIAFSGIAAKNFFRVNRAAGWLIIPHILFCIYLLYLNYGIFMLS